MMNVDGRMEVVDAASKGGEDDQCQGFMCEEGGKFLDAEDAEWMTYLDISWNSLTGEGYYLNARKTGGACVEFVDVGSECFPNYGETTSGPYFPCKPDEAMCA